MRKWQDLKELPVIMTGNDFENDLIKAGISLESITFADKPSYPVN
ncbi:hypothetical protein [Desulfosporosinus sp. HMP52]|nr:hypothetical protein [Desulfosporosinus sp. HMP52]